MTDCLQTKQRPLVHCGERHKGQGIEAAHVWNSAFFVLYHLHPPSNVIPISNSPGLQEFAIGGTNIINITAMLPQK